LLFGVCVVLFSALIGVAPLSEDLVFQLQNLDWQAMLVIFIAPVVLSLLFFMIIFPLAARFGLTKSIRLIPLAIFALFMLGMLGFQSTGSTLPPFIMDFIAWAMLPEGTVIIIVSALVIALVLYIASCFIATRVYTRREL
ncbi:MAG: ABC-2 transporter permease, partial [Raoultibacter sp.]